MTSQASADPPRASVDLTLAGVERMLNDRVTAWRLPDHNGLVEVILSNGVTVVYWESAAAMIAAAERSWQYRLAPPIVDSCTVHLARNFAQINVVELTPAMRAKLQATPGVLEHVDRLMQQADAGSGEVRRPDEADYHIVFGDGTEIKGFESRCIVKPPDPLNTWMGVSSFARIHPPALLTRLVSFLMAHKGTLDLGH